MIPPNDVVADLPAPMDDEPPSVRQDIADELADHLACAYRRELFRNADEGIARQQVLDRFGDPRRIAYQLWFQALWGRIMLNRFGRVVQGLEIVGGLLVLFFVFRMAEQQAALHSQLQLLAASNNTMQSQAAGNRMLLEQLLARFPAPPQPEGSGGMSSAMGMPMSGEGGAGSMMMGSGSPGMTPAMAGTGFAEGSSMMGTAMPPGMGSTAVVPERGLKLRITIQGEKNEPASGCVIAVTNESGESLAALIDRSPPENDPEAESMTGTAPGMSRGPLSTGFSATTSTGKPGRRLSASAKGEIYFTKLGPRREPQPLDPGRYTVQIEFPDGRRGTHRFAVLPGRKEVIHEENVACPPVDEMAYILFRTPALEKDFSDAEIQVRAIVSVNPIRIGKTEWSRGDQDRYWNLYFDPKTGALMWYDTLRQMKSPGEKLDNPNFYLADMPVEERFLSLPPGNYHVQLMWYTTKQGGYGFGWEQYPAEGTANKGNLTIASDTRDVLLDFPEEMLEELRKVLKPTVPDAPIETPTGAVKTP